MALLDNKNPTTKQVALKDGVLKTTGALVSMKVPDGWSALMSTASNPGFPPETWIVLVNSEENDVEIGLYFFGLTYEEIDGQFRREELFDKHVNMKAGTNEAKELVGGEGALSDETKMQDLILAAGRHAFENDEDDCRAIKTTHFNGLSSVIYEFENLSAKTRAIEYCIDVLGNGRVVYSLYYSAPIDAFAKNMDTAINAFQSSVWRKDFDPMVPLDVIS